MPDVSLLIDVISVIEELTRAINKLCLNLFDINSNSNATDKIPFKNHFKAYHILYDMGVAFMLVFI